MSRTIHKFTVPVDDRRHAIKIGLPAGITHVQALKVDEVTFWAAVDTDSTPDERYFTVVGTGHPIPADVIGVVGTAVFDTQSPAGNLVWHLIEVMFAADPTKPEA